MSAPILPPHFDRARVYHNDGSVSYFERDADAYAYWLALPQGTFAAFRGSGDARPVYGWDYVDRPAPRASARRKGAK